MTGELRIEDSLPLVDDQATVSPEGHRLARQVEGAVFRPAVVQSDGRGSLTEIYDPAWGLTPEGLVYAYESRIHPGQTKGWVVHRRQTDRLFFADGSAKIVLYDARVGSPTQGLVDERFYGSANRGVLVIPPGVVHAIVNVGGVEARFVNLPTRPYDHGSPDKARIAVDAGAVPYVL